jgi:hypothetical protein
MNNSKFKIGDIVLYNNPSKRYNFGNIQIGEKYKIKSIKRDSNDISFRYELINTSDKPILSKLNNIVVFYYPEDIFSLDRQIIIKKII